MSIGAGAGLRGREAERERERREYEEGRLVRLPEDGRGKKRRGGGMEVGGMGRGGAWDEVVGGGAGEGLGEAVRGGKGKRRRVESGGLGRRMGEMWEERKRRGVKGLSGGKRR